MEDVTKVNNVKTKQQSRFDLRLLLSVVLLSTMVFFRDLGYISFTPIHFIMAVVLICIALPYNSLKAFYFFYFSMGASIHGVALIPILTALILKSKKYNSYQIIFPVIILSFELLHLLSYSFSVEFSLYIVYGLYITLFFFLLFDDNVNDFDVKNEMKYYILGVTVTSIVIFIHSYKFFGFQDIISQNIRVGADFEDYDTENEMVTILNPNQLALYGLTALSLLIYVKDIFCNKMLKTILIITLVVSGILTGSRTWIILMAVVLALYFIFSKVRGKLSFAIIMITLLFVTFRFSDFGEIIYSRYESRFEDSGMSTAGDRTVLFKEYNKWLINNPHRIFYGAGAEYYNEVCKIHNSTHNSIQQIVVCYGIIGLLLFIVCMFVYHKMFPKRNHTLFLYYIPFFICFLFSQAGQFLSPAYMMFPFVAAALPLKLAPNIKD